MKKKIALKGDLSHMLVNPSAGLVLCAMIAMNGGVMADPKKELHLRRSEPLRSTRNAMVAWSIRKERHGRPETAMRVPGRFRRR